MVSSGPAVSGIVVLMATEMGRLQNATHAVDVAGGFGYIPPPQIPGIGESENPGFGPIV